MKKTFYLAIIAFLSVMSISGNAQDRATAILQHGDNMTAFYGINAFKQAYAAAESGDLISLSEGTFDAPEVTKAIRIQGAGGETTPTKISTDFTINLPEGEEGLYISGIRAEKNIIFKGNLISASIERTTFKDAINLRDATIKNTTFKQCTHKNSLIFPSTSTKGLSFINCHLGYTSTDVQGQDSDILFENCYSSSLAHLRYGIIRNCILRDYPRYLGVIGYNTLYQNSHLSYPGASATISGMYGINETEWNKIVVNGRLSDEAKTKYLGTDGTPVGVEGGIGFETIPAIPQIVESEVAGEPDADGKLKVKFSVKAHN